MINFKQYPNMTKCIIPNNVVLSDTDFSTKFFNFVQLQEFSLPNSVTNMSKICAWCTNLTTAVCGDKVTDMTYTYLNCYNLTTAVFGQKVINIYGTYENAVNIQGNTYLYSPNINAISHCFNGRYTNNMLNIYVPTNSTTLTTIHQYTNEVSIVGANITWTNNISNDYFYNTQYNIYIYPVENVAAAREANGD